jgi:broad specificity phosphatase PhoE
LYLIRHAESTWNAEGRVQGQSDPPLSERGRAQAARLADRFRDSGVTALYSSPLQRARRTAERMAEAAGLSLQIDDRLKEHNVGLFTGLVWQDIVQQYPDFARAWLERALDMPGGEKHEAFRARAAGVMQDIVARHPDGKVVVVTHGGILGEYLAHLLGLDPERRHPFHFDNASVSVLDAGGVLPRVHRLNDVSHLVTVVAPGDDAEASVDTHEDES